MNIFKALSEGNGRISETNVTSFMSYLLDSTNELRNSFFVMFAGLMDTQAEGEKIGDLLDMRQKSIRQRILSFSAKYTVSSEPEYAIQGADGKRQIPDVLLRVTPKGGDSDVAYIIIENKINRSAIKKGQMEKQLVTFSESEDFEADKPVFSVLITPDEPAFQPIFDAAARKNERTLWLKWTNHHDNENSIEAALRQLIRHEHNAEIEPIDPNTQFIIKSFVDYLATEFPQKEPGRKTFSSGYNGFDVVSQATAIIGSQTYIVKRFSNNMIRLFDENDTLRPIIVKPILREINTAYGLKISLRMPNGTGKTTQILGKEVIEGLNRG